MISSMILRSGVVAVGTLTASGLAVSAAQAHGAQSTHHNPAMQRMHELHMQDRHNMHAMDVRRHGR